MTVRVKLLVLILFVALVPLTVSALSTLRVHQTAYDQKVEELQQNAVKYRARLSEQLLANATASLAAMASPIDWGQLSESERKGALWLVYQQLPDIAAVQLVDEEGRGVGEGVFVGDPNDPDLGAHPVAKPELLTAFSKNLVLASEGVRIGSGFTAPSQDTPLLPLGVAVRGPDGKKWTIAVAMSLRSMCNQASELVREPLVVYLADDRNQVLCTSAPGRALVATAELRAKAGSKSGPLTLDSPSGPLLATVAPMSGQWMVVALQPRAAAMAAGQRIRLQAVFWIVISLVIALAGGWYLSRDISRPLVELTRGANELAEGNLAYRLEIGTRDEFARLAAAFNAMGGQVEKRDAEIRDWNSELHRRVEEQTRDLKQAQKQLLQSQKLASVSILAAGAAHEINNPLTTILGMTHLAKRRLEKRADMHREAEALESIEREATRIGDIVKGLGALADSQSSEGFAPVSLSPLLDDSVAMVRDQLSERGVELQRNDDEDLPQVRGDPSELQEVFLHLLTNALTACERGDSIHLSLRNIDGQMVKIEVADTGRGIEPEHLDRVFEPFFTTKQDWQGRGLGLSLAHRAIERHLGTIRIDSTLGTGTTVTILLPVFRAASTLR